MKQSMSVFRAAFRSLDGTEFVAFGETPGRATAALLDTLSRYAAEISRDPDWWTEQNSRGIAVTGVEMNVGYRDGHVYHRPALS